MALLQLTDNTHSCVKKILAYLKKHRPYLLLVLFTYILIFIGVTYFYRSYDPPFSNASDLTVHVARAYKLQDPYLYTRDPFYKDYGLGYGLRADYLLFPFLLSKSMLVLGGIKQTLIIFSLSLGVIFTSGIYFLTYKLTGNFFSGVLASFFANLDYLALGNVMLGFFPNHVLPRNFLVAVSPYILIMFLKWRESNYMWGIYAFLGVALNFHVLAPLHLLAILSLTYLLSTRFSWISLKRLILASIITAICALPFIISMTNEVSEIVTISEEESLIEIYRFPDALIPSKRQLVGFMVTVIPLLLLSLIELKQKHKNRNYSTYNTLFIITLILPWLGVAINRFTLSFRQLELLRITRYYYLLSFAPTAEFINKFYTKFKHRSYSTLSVILLMCTVSFISRPQVGYLVAKTLDKQANQDLTTSPTVQDEYVMEWNWPDAYELFTWVEANTPKDSLFMVPVEWGLFRVYAKRSMVVDHKNPYWSGWYETYFKVATSYQNPNPIDFIELASKYKVDYVIVHSGIVLPNYPLMFQNQFYNVYLTK